MKKPRMLLADDHCVVAEGLRGLLDPHFEVVGVVSDGRELVAAAKKLEPDVVVLDISMPSLNGIEALPAWVIDGNIEQGEQRRQRRLQLFVERAGLLDHLPADLLKLIPVLDPEIALEQRDHRQVARRSSVRDRRALEHEPAEQIGQPVRVGELMDKT